MHDLLPNSSLLTVAGWGHTSLFLSACADDAVNAYLLDGTTPPEGTVCTQDIGPFDPQNQIELQRARAKVMAEIISASTP